MTARFTSLDLVVLVGYFALTMTVGLLFWRKSRSVEGFTAANRSLPGWLTGLSILGTYVSSISFLALPGKAFAANWNPFVFSLGLFLLGLVSCRTNNRAAIAGVTTGVPVILWMTVSPKWGAWPAELRSPFHGLLIIVFGAASILLIEFLVTLFVKNNRTPTNVAL